MRLISEYTSGLLRGFVESIVKILGLDVHEHTLDDAIEAIQQIVDERDVARSMQASERSLKEKYRQFLSEIMNAMGLEGMPNMWAMRSWIKQKNDQAKSDAYRIGELKRQLLEKYGAESYVEETWRKWFVENMQIFSPPENTGYSINQFADDIRDAKAAADRVHKLEAKIENMNDELAAAELEATCQRGRAARFEERNKDLTKLVYRGNIRDRQEVANRELMAKLRRLLDPTDNFKERALSTIANIRMSRIKALEAHMKLANKKIRSLQNRVDAAARELCDG